MCFYIFIINKVKLLSVEFLKFYFRSLILDVERGLRVFGLCTLCNWALFLKKEWIKQGCVIRG